MRIIIVNTLSGLYLLGTTIDYVNENYNKIWRCKGKRASNEQQDSNVS